MNSDKKNGFSISLTINCNYNVVIQSQTSTSRSLYSPKSETRKPCYVWVPNAYGSGYKKAMPTYQLPKIDAKNVESLSAAIIFCKSDQNAKSCCKFPNFTK